MILKLKRGDTAKHFLQIPIAAYEDGMDIYFMAKPSPDDDLNDSAALISKHLTDADIISRDKDKVKYQLRFEADDTRDVKVGDESFVILQGEFELRTKDGNVFTFPGGNKFIQVMVNADIRRGGNG